MFIVFDLDGTVALPDHRLHHIRKEPKDYDAFYAACVDDEPNWPVIRIMMTLAACEGVRIEIWTGRSEAVWAETVRWFKHYKIEAKHFLTRMRPVGDHRPDFELKRAWLKEARDADDAPHLVYEDRDVVVNMWRQEGVPCFQVAPNS